MAEPEVARFYDRRWRKPPAGREARKRLEADAAAIDLLMPLEGRRALDLGAGSGAEARRLVAAGARVIAVDVSVEALRLVRAAAPEASVVVADAHALPFRAAAFDRAALFSVLMFLDAPRALDELARSLSPGGRLVVVEPTSGNPALRLFRALTRRYEGLARWLDRGLLLEIIRRRFVITRTGDHYLLPPATLLPDGALRRAWQRCEAPLCRLLPDWSWVTIVAAEKTHL